MQDNGLKDLQFPVYKLGSKPPDVSDGIVSYEYRREGGFDVRIVDNRNLEGSTLAARRLKMLANDIQLYTLSTAVFFVSDLLKLSTPSTWWIDSSGRIFRYIKTKSVRLIFRKITSKLRITTGCLIEAEGLPGRYKSLYPPLEGQEYAGFLRVSPHSYILYGFFNDKYKDGRRKI